MKAHVREVRRVAETLLRKREHAHEWSVSSDEGPGGEPYRLVVAIDPEEDSFVEIVDGQVTSRGADWELLVGKYPKLNLSASDVEWLLEVLPGALAELRRVSALLEAEAAAVNRDAEKAERSKEPVGPGLVERVIAAAQESRKP